jgi:hypothetical protein
MGMTATILTGILASILASIFFNEFVQWRPLVVRKLIALAVRRLPGNQRDRYLEEWTAHSNEVPGDLGKVIVAIGCLVAAESMAGKANVFERVFAFTAVLFLVPALALIFFGLLASGTRPLHVTRSEDETRLRFSTPPTLLGSFLYQTGLNELPMLLTVVAGRHSLGDFSLRRILNLLKDGDR